MVELEVVIWHRHDWHAVSGLTNIGPYYLTFVTECEGEYFFIFSLLVELRDSNVANGQCGSDV